MLAAGMLSTVPAIVINSVISPILVALVGLDAFTAGTLGEGLILFVSAPVGEELSKALAVMALSHLIVSPKHGFYVGSTVGLGFALLENASYISMALASDWQHHVLFTASAARFEFHSRPCHVDRSQRLRHRVLARSRERSPDPVRNLVPL